MLSKEQTRSKDEADSKRHAPKPANDKPDVLAQQQTQSVAPIQQARLPPKSLTPGNVLQLQRTIGNQAVGQLLAQTKGAEKGAKQDVIQRTGFWWDRSNWNTPDAPAPFVEDKIKYGSVESGLFGSIYFDNGPNSARIRLIHRSGPQISQHDNVKAFSVSTGAYKQYNKWKKEYKKTNGQRPDNSERYLYITNTLKCPETKAGVAGKIIEFFDEGRKGSHPSRGEAQNLPITLTQADINTLYNLIGKFRNNNALHLVMTSDPELKKIPIHKP